MEAALKRLIKRMPPPEDEKDRQVDWNRLETAIGFSYPASFKEFIGVYGSSIWFDHACPYYSTAKSDADVKAFLRRVTKTLQPLEGRMRDIHRRRVDIPLYPVEGGLYPFMIDYGGSVYCWKTEQKIPTRWPIVCWFMGDILVLEKMTIAQMMIQWLERKPSMVDMWGDPNDLPEARIRLS